VCSSVLEALALKTPVVASENGSRPEGVITYENQNIDDMVSSEKPEGTGNSGYCEPGD